VVDTTWSTKSTRAVILPTSMSSGQYAFQVPIEMDGTPTVVLCAQIRTVSVDRIGDFAGVMDPEEVAEVDGILRDLPGLWLRRLRPAIGSGGQR
jgi:mRNA interferase MazF